MFPERLGDAHTIGVYSPSGAFSDSEEEAELFENGLRRLRDLGFAVRLSDHCRSSWWHASARPQDRAADLHALLADPDVDVILPSLGGHVVAQALRFMDLKAVATSGKALFGFSDNSIVALAAASAGAVTFHTACDVAFGFGRSEEPAFALTEASFLEAVLRARFDLGGLQEWQVVNPGTGQGTTLGGNLHALTTLAGTPWWPDWRGKVMFWETGGPLHVVAQDLVTLWNTGALDHLAGMVIGRVADLGEDFYPRTTVIPLDVLLLDVFGLRGRYPIICEADLGHDVSNVTVPLGVQTRLHADDSTIVWTVEP